MTQNKYGSLVHDGVMMTNGDRLNTKVKGLKFGNVMKMFIEEFRDKHPQKNWKLFPIINHANNWIQVRSSAVCHYINLNKDTGKVTIRDAEHGTEFAPKDHTIYITNPAFEERLNSWFKEIWGVF